MGVWLVRYKTRLDSEKLQRRYRAADKSLARPTSRCISLDGENILFDASLVIYINTKVGPKVSGLTHKSRTKWKMLRGIYSTIYGEVNVSVSVCVEIKGDSIEK